MGSFIDLTSKVFGRLTVLERLPNVDKTPYWLCICSCMVDRYVRVSGGNLRNEQVTSCGCKRIQVCGNQFRTHGLSGTKEYKLLKDAKKRAKNLNREFNIDISDIVIPKKCPILNIDIVISLSGKPTNNSPSLDRIDSSRGYIKGNVRVISVRANRLKQDSSIEELESILQYMRGLK